MRQLQNHQRSRIFGPTLPPDKLLNGGSILLITAAISALYWPSVYPLIQLWADPGRFYTQGFPILGASILIIATRLRTAGPGLTFRPQVNAVPAVFALSMVWLVLARSGIQTAHELLLPLILWTGFLAALGAQAARICLFPCALLYFGIPAWDYLGPPLQWLTVTVVGYLLRIAHVPAHISGNFVQIPAGTFEIAGGCNGLHYLLVALAIATLYGEICSLSLRDRVSAMFLATALGLMSNWVRVFSIILIGQLTSMQHHLVRVEHYWFGWLIFAGMQLLFFAAADRIVTPGGPPKLQAARPASWRSVAATGCALLLVLAIAPAWSSLRDRQSPAKAVELTLPSLSGWSGPLPTAPDWLPVYPNADARQFGAYQRDPTLIKMFVAEYASGGHSKKLVGYGIAMTKGDDSVVANRSFALDGIATGELRVRNAVDESELLWYRFTVGERSFASSITAQLWYGLVSLTSSPQTRITVVRAACRESCDATQADLVLFFRQVRQLAAGAGKLT